MIATPTEATLSRAAELLRAGGLVAIPTETVYGLAANAEDELAVRRIFAAKGRPATHPLIVHLPERAALPRWASAIPPEADRLADAFWPGPLTLVLPRSGRASDAVTGGQPTVALRMPAHPVAQALLQRLGGGLAAPSANRFGRVSPTTARHVEDELGDRVDLILDGGPCAIGVESTIVDLSGPTPTLLRPGGVAREELERVLGRPVPVATASSVRAPGTLPSHYAPRAGLELVPSGQLASRAGELRGQGLDVAVLSAAATASGLPAGVRHFPIPEDSPGFARALYAVLREIDQAGCAVVVCALPEERGLGLAIADRLRRAAAPRPSRR